MWPVPCRRGAQARRRGLARPTSRPPETPDTDLFTGNGTLTAMSSRAKVSRNTRFFTALIWLGFTVEPKET